MKYVFIIFFILKSWENSKEVNLHLTKILHALTQTLGASDKHEKQNSIDTTS